jgi:hypothetical protein
VVGLSCEVVFSVWHRGEGNQSGAVPFQKDETAEGAPSRTRSSKPEQQQTEQHDEQSRYSLSKDSVTGCFKLQMQDGLFVWCSQPDEVVELHSCQENGVRFVSRHS